EVEVAGIRSRDAPGAEAHDLLAVRIHLVDDVPGRVDRPDVPVWIHAHGVSAARRAPRRPVHGRIVRRVVGPMSLWNGADLSLAEQAVAPRADELPVALEFHDRVRAAMEYQDAAAACD